MWDKDLLLYDALNTVIAAEAGLVPASCPHHVLLAPVASNLTDPVVNPSTTAAGDKRGGSMAMLVKPP